MPALKPISMDELDGLQIDEQGALHWRGDKVTTSRVVSSGSPGGAYTMQTVILWCTWGAGIAGLVAAVLWWWAASITIPDNVDTFIGELQRMGRISRWAAGASGVTALLTAMSVFLRA